MALVIYFLVLVISLLWILLELWGEIRRKNEK